MTKPNFFLIGAPKCGTTALSEYLRTHPNVFFSDPKEPDFFSEDIQNRHKVRELHAYRRLFADATSNNTQIGEGSVSYLLSKVAVSKILEFSPTAKFVVMLRNPVDLAYSWHSEARYNCGETEPDFERAWRLQEDRAAGRNIPSQCPDVQLLLYREVGAIGSQLQRAIDTIPAGRLHVIFFDDFRRDTRAAYEGTLRFLGLESDRRTEFPVINESKLVRSPLLMELSHKVAEMKQRFAIHLGTGLLEAFNVPRKSRPALSPAFRNELIDYFRPEVEKIERATGRELSAWKQAA